MATKILRSMSSDNLMPTRPRFMRTTSTDSAAGGAGGDRRKNMMRSLSKGDVLGVSKRAVTKGTEALVGGVKKGVEGVGKGVVGVAGAAGKGTGAAARGLEKGVTGVAVGAAIGASYGFELGAAGVAGAAGLATNGARALGRPKASSARRRQSEFNVFGDGDLVSVEFLLQNIKAATKNKDVTKLELEDLVNGKDKRDAQVFDALKDLLKDDFRPWVYIKFVDSLRVGVLGDGLDDIKRYEKKRQTLWEHIKLDGSSKPIMFQLKLEIEEDTPASTIIEILNKLQEYNLARIEYLGGLWGFKAPEVGEALADLCRPEDPDASIAESGMLKEMIMLTLHYAAGESEKPTSGNSPPRDRVWKKVLRRSVKRLGGQVPPSLGDSEHGFSTRSRSRSRSPLRNSSEHSPTRGRAASPKSPTRKQSGSDLSGMRAAIAANRARSPKRSPSAPTLAKPAMRRVVSEGIPEAQSMGGSAHTKRRKQRSFASAIQELDMSDSIDDSAQSFGEGSGEFALGNGSSNNNANDHGTIEPKQQARDRAPSKPLPRRRGVIRSASSPMQKRPPLIAPVESEKKGVERSTSMKKKLRPSASSDEPTKRPSRRSTSRSRSPSPRPSYDWSKHSSHHGGDIDWSQHAAASKSTDELDESQACVAKTA